MKTARDNVSDSTVRVWGKNKATNIPYYPGNQPTQYHNQNRNRPERKE
jgi:hypothetical protein